MKSPRIHQDKWIFTDENIYPDKWIQPDEWFYTDESIHPDESIDADESIHPDEWINWDEIFCDTGQPDGRTEGRTFCLLYTSDAADE